MARLVGEMPPLWASYWASNESLKDRGTPVYLFICGTLFKHFVPEISAARASAEWMNYRTGLVQICKSEEEADCVIDLLRSMLILDPAGRPSIRQVMITHHWLQPNSVV